MSLTLFAALALLSPPVAAPDSPSERVTGASLFKNGFAFVTREISVRGPGEVIVGELPQASLGTYWITASKGLQISQVVRTSVEGQSERDAVSLEELLDANVGHTVQLVARVGATENTYSGKLLASSGQLLIIQTDRTLAFPKSDVLSISSDSGQLLYKLPYKTNHDVLKVMVKSASPGTIYTVGLERGMSWMPAYAVDITDPKSLSLVAKSTLTDDLTDLKNVEVRFVTGFPNIPWADVIEPLLSPQAAVTFTNFSLGGQLGGGGGRREAMQNAASAPAADFEAAFSPSNLGGIQAEDLFFYRQPGVTLKKGDRAYYILFRANSEYSHLYTLDISDNVVNNSEYRPSQEGPLDVWHSLKFKNTSGQPLTTAPATVFKGGEIVGQDTLSYTSNGSEALIRMSKALDVHAEQTEEEVTRERANLKTQSAWYDLVTLKGTIRVQNAKPEEVKLKITKDLTGEVVASTGDPKLAKLAKGLIQINPRAHLEWTPALAGGKNLTLTYSYKLYVRSS